MKGFRIVTVLAVFIALAVPDGNAEQAIPLAAVVRQLAGVWNVTSTTTGDVTCKDAQPGDTASYVWIINIAPNGEVSVSVQGQTGFPTLRGRWNPQYRVLALEGSSRGGLFGELVVSWFKLAFNDTGTELHGVRRVVSGTGSRTISGAPCFADFTVSMKHQG